ncbi:oligosaccharide flippase family protein [Priestia aryabhattai]|uniref:oligosaccharide flippase family protein n=1 Tax=Priestia aryabhattai TaxID=412384 RepID=UPI0039A36BEE
MSLKKKLASSKNKNILDISVLWISQFGAVGIAFFTQLLLARILKVEDYGSFTSAINIVTILGGAAAFGAGSNWLRAFGVEGWKAHRWVRPTIKINLIIASIVIVGLLVSTYYMSVSDSTKILTIIFISILLSLTFSTAAEAVYQLEEKYQKLSLLKFSVQGLRFLVVLIASFIGANLLFIGIGYAFGAFILIYVYFRIIKRLYKRKVELKGHAPYGNRTINDIPGIKTAFKYLLPYGSTIVFYSIYFQSNIFIIGLMSGEESVALYNVAFTILNVIYLFPTTFYQSYLIPKVHRWGENNEEKMSLLFKQGSKIVLTIGIIIMLAVAGCASFVVPLLFGERYAEASLILMLLSITIPFRLLCNNLGSILVTEKHVVKKAYYQMTGAIVSIVLNVVFINLWGVYGAAFATIITEFIVMLLFIIGVNSYVPAIKNHKWKNTKKFTNLLLVTTLLVVYYFYVLSNNVTAFGFFIPILVIGLFLIYSLVKLIKNDLIISVKKLLL